MRGGVGVCCVSACGGGRRALSSTDRAPSYVEDLIHVTGGCCHSAAHRHLTRCQLQVIKRAYGRCTEWRTPPPCLLGSGLCQELCVGGGGPERPTHYCRIKTPQVLTQRQGRTGLQAKRQSQLSSSGLWSNRKLAQEPNICLFGFTANSAHTISHRFDFGNTQWMSPIITFTNKVQQSVRTRCSFPFIYMELNLASLTMLSLYQTLWNKYLKNKTRICFLPLKKIITHKL